MGRSNVLLLLRDLFVYRRSLIILIVPILLLPIPLLTSREDIGQREANCCYVVLLMAIFWMCEVVPLAVTSLIPLFLFPLLGVLDAKTTSANYLKDTNFLFFGGLMVALAVEQSNLHKRLALGALLGVGSKPRWLMFGLMGVTAFLSMWISNTATTAMMVPIAIAVLEELVAPTPSAYSVQTVNLELGAPPKSNMAVTHIALNALNTSAYDNNAMVTIDEVDSSAVPQVQTSTTDTSDKPHNLNVKSMTKANANMCKGVLLSICYAANIGGTGTLTGTGPNLVLRGVLTTLYGNADTGITFASWMMFAVPPMIVYLLAAWLLLQICFLDIRDLWRKSKNAEENKRHERVVTALLRKKFTDMGHITFAEVSVLIWFLLLVGLWIFRDPKFMPGWSVWFKTGYVSDGSVAMMIGCIMFAWPNQVPDFLCLRRDPEARPKRRDGLITWGAMQKKFPWSVIMLLGGGFALANGVKESGMSLWVGCKVQGMISNWPDIWVLTMMVTFITFKTETSSNTATASVFIPIVVTIAEYVNVNPLYFALPATICPSFAFMLPIATPPNAIVYETKMVSIKNMMWVGFIMNVIAIVLTLINTNTYAKWLFDLGTNPAWAVRTTNETVCPL